MATAGIFPNLDAVAETHRERDVAFFLKKKKNKGCRFAFYHLLQLKISN